MQNVEQLQPDEGAHRIWDSIQKDHTIEETVDCGPFRAEFSWCGVHQKYEVCVFSMGDMFGTSNISSYDDVYRILIAIQTFAALMADYAQTVRQAMLDALHSAKNN